MSSSQEYIRFGTCRSVSARLFCRLGPTVLGMLITGPALAQTAPSADTIQLDTVDVRGRPAQAVDTPPGTTGYVATRDSAGTKTDTPLREVPQAITVVTRKQLDDRDVQTLKEAIAYTPGVTTDAFGYDPRFDSFYIRGFDVTYTGIYRDGLRQDAANFSVPKIEPYGLQSLSILRGPASGLYGLGSPGGIVDVVTKHPTSTPFGELQLQAGNYNRYQGNFDLGGPVVGAEQFSYRLTGVFRDADTFLPGAKDNRTYIAPAVSWQPDSDTRVTLLTEYQTSKTTGNASYFNGPDHHLTDIYSNDPAFGAQDQHQGRVGYEVEHRFSDLLTVRQNFRFYHSSVDARYTEVDAVDEATQTATRSTGHVQESLNTVELDNQAESHFRLGAVDNTVLTGLSYNHSTLHGNIGFGAAPDLDLITRNYGAQAIAAPTPTIFYHLGLDEVSLYAQEQARFGGFVLTLNGQQSWVSQSSLTPGSTAEIQHDSAFTGRVGLSYLFDNGVTPYVSYATAYAPQLGINAAGAAFRPTTGDQVEGGVKYQMPSLPILVSGAVFDIVQNNVLRIDPNNIAFQAATGQVESKGFELEAQASLAPGIDLTAAYTHLDVRITRGNDDTTGRQLSGIPGDSVAAFGKYTFQPGSAVAGLGLGAGVRFIGSNFGDDQNTFRNPGVVLFDAVADYDAGALDPRLKGVRLQINATNLLDKRYAACQSGFCYANERREVIGSLVYRF